MAASPQPTSVQGAVAQVARRMRAQAALDLAARAALGAGGLLLVAVFAWRVGWISTRGLAVAAGGLAALVAAAALAGAARRVRAEVAAKRIDRAHGLADRIGSALAFAGSEPRSPLEELAIRDGERAAKGAAPRLAAPLAPPPDLWPALAVAALALVVARLDLVLPGAPAAPPAPAAATLALDAGALLPEREQARALADLARAGGDPILEETARQLERLIQQIDRRELTRKQVLDKLAELEQRALAGDRGNFEELAEKLRKAGLAMGKANEKLSRPSAKALSEVALERARQEMESLAKQLAGGQVDPAAAKKLAGALDRAAQPQPPSKEEQKAADEKRRLEKEQEKLAEEQKREQEAQEKAGSESERTQARSAAEQSARRLSENRRGLDKLSHEAAGREKGERQLKQLQRQLSSAADQARQGNQNGSAQSMRDAAKTLGQMENERRQSAGAQSAKQAIAQVRETIQRMASARSMGAQRGQQSMPQAGMQRGTPQGGMQSGAGQNGAEQPAGEGQKGSSGSEARAGEKSSVGMQAQSDKVGAKGQQGGQKIYAPSGQQGSGQGQAGAVGKSGEGEQKGPQPEKLGDFFARSGGDGKRGGDSLLTPGQGDGAGGPQLAMPGESPGAGQGPSAEREQSQALGDGIGDSHDPNVSGAPSHISARHVDARVHGQIGAGPSRSETILGAADRGFAQTGYRQVYGDYTSVVEEVMSKHEVPPGYRYYVKRYFELIRPRE